MPRDASETRQRLIDVGRQMFATRGVFATPLKAIVDASRQRNASALHYHFGNREGLLLAIIEVTNAGIERRRETLLDEAGTAPTIADLVGAWIEPQATLLGDAEGRQFLSVASQLNDRFDAWSHPGSPAQARRCLVAIDGLLDIADPAVRNERLIRFMELTVEALGSRARRIDRGVQPALDHQPWVDNLAAMSIGALLAPPTGRTLATPS